MMDMEYRADMAISFIQSLVFIFFNLTFYRVIIGEIGGLGDWNYWEMVLLFGAFTALDGIFMAFIVSNVNGLGKLVNTGALDHYLVKPLDVQFYVSSRFVNYAEILSILQGVILMGVALWKIRPNIGVLEVLLFLVTLVCSVLIYYAMGLMFNSIVFFTERGDEISEIIFSLKQFAKLPNVYSGTVRYFFMFVTPLIFSSFVPAGVLIGHVSPAFIMYYIVITAVFVLTSRYFFKYCLSKYKSAGG